MTEQGNRYAGSFRKARRTLRRVLTSPWGPISPDEIERTCDWLQGLGHHEFGLWTRNTPRAQHPQVVRQFVQRAFDERYTNTQLAHELAQKAVRVTEALRYPDFLGSLVFDLQAEALGHLANSLRLLENHARSEEMWELCEERRAQGSGDLLLLAELARHKAALRRDQRRYEDAVQLQRESARPFEKIGEEHRSGRVRLAQAVTLFDAGDPGAAIDTAALAGGLLDCDREPEMGFALLHNTLFFLEAMKQPRLTAVLFHKLEPFYADAGSPLIIVRCWWLEGRLLAAEGNWRPAARHFDGARQAFVEHKLTYDAALAGFDAAHAYA